MPHLDDPFRDDNLWPHPRTVFPVHRDANGKLVGTTETVPFPVSAELKTSGAILVLLEVMNKLLIETRATNFYLAHMSGQRLSARDKETLE